MTSKRRLGRIQLQRRMKPINGVCVGTLMSARGTVFDVSTGGLFFATSEPYPVGEFVRVSFEWPDVGPIEVRGTVRWNTALIAKRPHGFGMEIEGPPEVFLEFCKALEIALGEQG